MKQIKNLFMLFLLGVFAFGTSYFVTRDANAEEITTTSAATTTYAAGSLLTLEGIEGGAVYLIGNDGKKYVFPDQKTYMTWYENFTEVIKVDQATLDSYPDGGTVPFQAGIRLLTHPCTAKVYAVGADGEVVHIPDEATAMEFYGSNWKELVQDVDCGLFAVSYKVRAGVLGVDNLLDGTVVQDSDTDELFYLEDGKRRLITANALRENNFLKKAVVKAKIRAHYQEGDEVEFEEEYELEYDPSSKGQPKVYVCHNGKTIRIARPALNAHLKQGSTEGRCESTDDDDDNNDDNNNVYPVCDHNGDGVRNLVDLSLFAQCQGTYDANGDGVHNLTDYALYAQNNQNDSWCSTNFVCNPNEEQELAVCDHNGDGVRNLVDVSYFGSCQSTFDVNGDGVHDLVDISLYAQNNQNDSWCSTNFVCETEEEELPDLTISDLTVSPANPVVGEEVIITEYIKNSGNITLTTGAGVTNGYKVFQDFASSTFYYVPNVSVDEPLNPGETVEMSWKGYFSSAGTKNLWIKVDNANELEESNEDNNTYSMEVEVVEESTYVVCDHNGDGERDLADLSYFATCQNTFDVNGDGVHDLLDISTYSTNHSDDNWCTVNFVCDPGDDDHSTTTEYTPTEN